MAIEENEDKTGESEDEEPFPFPEAPISEVSPQIYEREDQETDEATEASYVTKSNTANTDSLLYKYNPADVISRFFSENILAKLGGILLFLGVLFFLALIGPAIFNLIGPVGKIVIGFMIGFGLFGVGVWLDGR